MAIRPSVPRARATIAVAILALVSTACGGRFVEISGAGEIELDVPAETSVIVAADGTRLAELHAEQDRDLVPLENIPQVLRDAVVAVEDQRFYEHAGVDGQAIARAFLQNVQEGRVTQGGSTITQQLAKNAITGPEQTLERKLEEASLALQLENQYSKDEILERYLNTVYFGGGAYGVQTASRHYFAIDVANVQLPQAALLAGLLKAPTNYDPFEKPEAAKDRRDLVLRRMVSTGAIDQAQADEAAAQPIEVMRSEDANRWRFPYFVDHVMDLLQHDPGFHVLGADAVARADMLFRGGLRIETTLDPGWQASAEQAVRDTLTDPDDPRAALVAIDPRTGDIRALIGGRDYYDDGDPQGRFNLAVDGLRQPGSSFKPLVLAAALEQGRSLDTLYQAPGEMEIPAHPPAEPEPWTVTNYNETDFGELSLWEATAFSVNTVFAQLIDEVSPQAVVRNAQAAGISRPLPPYRSLALGAVEVSPLDMATVAATFAASGVYHEPTAITRITAQDGTVLYERPAPEGEQALEHDVAWQVTNALKGVIDHGTGERANLQRPMAGKTGTSQDSADAWFMGYTPDLAAAIWVGFPDRRTPMLPPRTRIPVEGGTWPAEMFARFGLRALADVPANDFAIPDSSLVRVRLDISRSCLPNPYTPPEVVEERDYLAGTEPTEVCAEPTGPPTADVPSVVGLPAAEATQALQSAGFVVTEQPEFSVALPPGFVVRQTPAPGPEQTLEDGYTATIYVSSADRTDVVVPDTLGMTAAEAEAALAEAGFIAEVTVQCPDGTQECTGAQALPGRVWEQAPSAGGAATIHSIVRLWTYPGG